MRVLFNDRDIRIQMDRMDGALKSVYRTVNLFYCRGKRLGKMLRIEAVGQSAHIGGKIIELRLHIFAQVDAARTQMRQHLFQRDDLCCSGR